MRITSTITMAVLAVLLSGCGSGDKNGEPQGAIPEPQLKALEKAKGTEKMMQDAEEQRRKQMEEQGL